MNAVPPRKRKQEPVNGEQRMIESAAPEGLLEDPRVHAAWALFFSKFITAYKEQVWLVWVRVCVRDGAVLAIRFFGALWPA